MLNVENVCTHQHRSVRSVHNQIAHQRMRRHRRDAQDARGLTGRSMPHNNESRMRIWARLEQNEDGREGQKKEEQGQDGADPQSVAEHYAKEWKREWRDEDKNGLTKKLAVFEIFDSNTSLRPMSGQEIWI